MQARGEHCAARGKVSEASAGGSESASPQAIRIADQVFNDVLSTLAYAASQFDSKALAVAGVGSGGGRALEVLSDLSVIGREIDSLLLDEVVTGLDMDYEVQAFGQWDRTETNGGKEALGPSSSDKSSSQLLQERQQRALFADWINLVRIRQRQLREKNLQLLIQQEQEQEEEKERESEKLEASALALEEAGLEEPLKSGEDGNVVSPRTSAVPVGAAVYVGVPDFTAVESVPDSTDDVDLEDLGLTASALAQLEEITQMERLADGVTDGASEDIREEVTVERGSTAEAQADSAKRDRHNDRPQHPFLAWAAELSVLSDRLSLRSQYSQFGPSALLENRENRGRENRGRALDDILDMDAIALTSAINDNDAKVGQTFEKDDDSKDSMLLSPSIVPAPPSSSSFSSSTTLPVLSISALARLNAATRCVAAYSPSRYDVSRYNNELVVG